MSNPFSGLITEDLKTTVRNAISALLEPTALTVPCKLYFTNTKLVDCPNCKYDVLTQRSSNQYTPGGPIPFANGQICPYCSGSGSLSFSAEETLYFALIKPIMYGYANMDLKDVNFIDGKIQSVCSIEYYAKVKNCSHIIIDTAIIDLATNKYIRERDPMPIGFGSTDFIITTWRAVQ